MPGEITVVVTGPGGGGDVAVWPGCTGSVIGGRIPGTGLKTVVVGDGDVLDVVELVVVSVGSVVSVGVDRCVDFGYWFTSVRGTQVYSGLGTKPGGTTAGGGVGAPNSRSKKLGPLLLAKPLGCRCVAGSSYRVMDIFRIAKTQ